MRISRHDFLARTGRRGRHGTYRPARQVQKDRAGAQLCLYLLTQNYNASVPLSLSSVEGSKSLVIPQREGKIPPLGEPRSAELTLGDPCYGPANAHPPTVEEEGAFCS